MSQGFKDPWAILGVERNASDAEIKSAYRRLARRYHPDKNPGDQEAANRFADIARAYESISTEEKRAMWSAEHDQPFGGARSSGGPASTPFPDLDDEMSAAAEKIEHTINLDFQQAFHGVQTEVEIDTEEICNVCGGSGSAPGHKPRACEICGGTGEHRVGRVVTKCSGCNGRGFRVTVPCLKCIEGKISQRRPFVLKIPAGVYDGYKVGIDAPQRGRIAAPTIEVTVKVADSPVFRRELADPADLMIEVPISFSEAVLGAAVKIPTPTRLIALKVPPGTRPGKPFRVAGEGMPKVDAPDKRGDLYAQVQVVVPVDPNPKQERLIRELAEGENADELRKALFSPLASSAHAL